MLNHDPEAIQYSISAVGDDYGNMYLMIDHGLFTELEKCKIPGSGVLVFSGLSTAGDEVLIRGNAEYRILDVGKLVVGGEDTKAYVKVKLVGKADKAYRNLQIDR